MHTQYMSAKNIYKSTHEMHTQHMRTQKNYLQKHTAKCTHNI